MKFIREHSLLLLLLGVSALLRFMPVFDYQFTLDELSGLNRTRFDSFSELIEKGVKIDAHPALIQVLIFAVVKLFGYGNAIVKLPFLLMSLGLVVYAYAFAWRNFSKQAGVFSALIFSFSLVFVFYAPIARMYISGLFFSAALLTHFYEIVFHQNTKPLHYFLMGLFALLSALNQHINALFAFTLCVSGVLIIRQPDRKAYLLTCFFTVLAYLPHLPITLYQLGLGGIGLEQGGWLEPPEWTALLSFLQIVLGTGFAWIVFLLVLVLRIIDGYPFRFETKHLLLLLMFVLNYWIVYHYSVQVSPIYQHSVMLFSGTAFVFFLSSFLEFRRKGFFVLAFVLLSGTLIWTTYFKKDVYRQTLNTVFEFQFQRTFDYQKQFGSDRVLAVFFDADEFMRDLYFERYKGRFQVQLSSDSATQRSEALVALLRSAPQDILVLSSPNPLHEAIAKQYFPVLIESNITQANNTRVYARQLPLGGKAATEERVLFNAGLHSGLECKFHTSALPASGGFSQLLDSLVEFPLETTRGYSAMNLKEGNFIVLRLKGKALRLKDRVMEICLSVSDKNTNQTLQYSAASIRSACYVNDSSFVLHCGWFVGTKHKQLLHRNAVLKAYVWNRGRESVEVEDFSIRVIDHWPEKWGFWK